MVTLVVSTHLCTPLPRIPPLYKAGLLWCCVERTRKTTYDSWRRHSDHLEPRHLRTLDPRILITLGIPTILVSFLNHVVVLRCECYSSGYSH